ncbi:MAG: hypothetical protein WB995_09895 [Candidatus Acidiferrales bacterium]
MARRGEADERQQADLCADCIHAQKIRNDRGSQFILCRLSAKDSNFAKYPRLPVRECSGYKKQL